MYKILAFKLREGILFSPKSSETWTLSDFFKYNPAATKNEILAFFCTMVYKKYPDFKFRAFVGDSNLNLRLIHTQHDDEAVNDFEFPQSSQFIEDLGRLLR